MNLKVWARTLMTIQKYLERICNSIDACIEKKATASMYVNTKNFFQNDSLSVSNWMIEMGERKVNLINLNVICLNALKSIDKTHAKILALKYFDRMQSADISSLLGISERTYFRKLNAAYESLESWLLKNGYDAEYFVTKLQNEGWITEVYYETQRLMSSNQTKYSVLAITPLYLEKVCRAIK